MAEQEAGMDHELLSAFSEEIKKIKAEAVPIIDSLKRNPSQPVLIEKFGNAIDRIYGTAATMGFKELAEYARAIKTVCYKTAQSNNVYAYGAVKDLLWVCTQNFNRLESSVLDPKAMRQLRAPFTDERVKAEMLMRNLLNKIKRGSV